MNIGFTGTQRGMTGAQLEQVWNKLIELDVAGVGGIAHHGDCIGADWEFHRLCREAGVGWLVGHPPLASGKRAWCDFDEVREPRPYLDRDQDIVRESEVLLACPFEMEEILRSGTWSTVRYARRARTEHYIVLPNGEIQ